MGKYTKHRDKWSNCTACPLHKTRKKVVFCRGHLPCDILFIGEAPGHSEDVIGSPFIGPSGKLLDFIIEQSLDGQYEYAITNLVACIPLENGDIIDPPRESIDACRERLNELIAMAKPKIVVTVGKIAEKHAPQGDYAMASITHPAAILYMNQMAQPLEIKRAIAIISDVVDELQETR